MFKLFLVSFLTNFVNEILSANVGTKIFKGKGVISKSGPDGTTLDLDLGRSAKYSITVKHNG